MENYSEEIIIRKIPEKERENSNGQVFEVIVNGKELENIKEFCISIDTHKDKSIVYRTTNVVPKSN